MSTRRCPLSELCQLELAAARQCPSVGRDDEQDAGLSSNAPTVEQQMDFEAEGRLGDDRAHAPALRSPRKPRLAGWMLPRRAWPSLLHPPKPGWTISLIAIELLGQGVDPTALDDARCSALHYASGADLRPQLLFQKLSPVAIFIVQPCVMPQA